MRQLEAALAERERLPGPQRRAVHIGVIEQSGSADHDKAVRLAQSAADIVLHRSSREGFGLVVTEALMRGKAVVASRVGGIPLQISHGRTGLLLSPDVPDEAWISAVSTLATDRCLRARLGSLGRAEVMDRHLVDRQLVASIDGLSNLLILPSPE
jgi:trehalose synthase